jgi:hypothetical protein
LSGNWHKATNHELTKIEWYAIKYDLNLFSNFTYSLAEPMTSSLRPMTELFGVAKPTGLGSPI